MGNRDLPDIYTFALGPARDPWAQVYIHQAANPSCPCYNLYIYTYTHSKTTQFMSFTGSTSELMDDQFA